MDYFSEKEKEITRLQLQLEDISESIFEDCSNEFTSKFNMFYHFTDKGAEPSLMGAEDMEIIISNFLNSECKTWKEFSFYLADEFISIMRKHLKN